MLIIITFLLTSCNANDKNNITDNHMYVLLYDKKIEMTNELCNIIYNKINECLKNYHKHNAYFYNKDNWAKKQCVILVSNWLADTENKCYRIGFLAPDYICSIELKIAFDDPNLYNSVISNLSYIWIETAMNAFKNNLKNANDILSDILVFEVIALNHDDKLKLLNSNDRIKYSWLTNVINYIYWDSNNYSFIINNYKLNDYRNNYIKSPYLNETFE
jgi:hypothetical protein